MSDKQQMRENTSMTQEKSGASIALWLLLILVAGGVAIALYTGALRLSDTARAAFGLKPAEDVERMENLFTSARQTESALNNIRENITSTRSWLEKTNTEFSDKLADLEAEDESTRQISAALGNAAESMASHDYRSAVFYYSYALLRNPGSAEILFLFSDSMEATIENNLSTGQTDEALENIDQLEQALNGGIFTVPLENTELLRDRLQHINSLRERIAAMDEPDNGVSNSLDTALDTLDAGNNPSWSLQLSEQTPMTVEAIEAALAEREAVYGAAFDFGKSLTDGRYAELGQEIAKYRALLVDLKSESDFTGRWRESEALEENGRFDMAALLLQGAESVLRQRMELYQQLPLTRRESIAADFRLLQEKSQELAVKAMEETQKSAFDAAIKFAESKLRAAKEWAEPIIQQPAIGSDLAEDWNKFINELTLYDKAKTGACQSQIELLNGNLTELGTLLNGITLPRYREEIDAFVVELNKEMIRAHRSQSNLYSKWAVGRISATWRYGIDFVGYTWDNEKNWADGMVQGMAAIDTQLLSRDANLLFNNVHDKLFSHMEDASDASEETEEKYKLNLIHRFLKTEKARLEDF